MTSWRDTSPEYIDSRIMDELEEIPGSAAEIADVLGLAKNTVHKAMQRLEHKGLVEVDKVMPKAGKVPPFAVYRAVKTKKGLTIEQSKDMFALHKWAGSQTHPAA